MTGRMLAWVGGAAVILGAIFFLSLAFSRGWIGSEARVAIGLATGGVFIGAGALLFDRKQAQLAPVLEAVGLGVGSLALYAGTRLYGLFPPEAALAGSFGFAVLAAAIAVSYDSQAVAIYGLVAVLAAPPVMGAGASLVTVAFVGVTLLGTTAIVLARSWRWLPPIAFSLSAPELIAWLLSWPGPDARLAVAVIGGYWLLHALASAADEFHKPQVRFERRARLLFLANSLLATSGGLYVLSGDLDVWQGAFVGAVALAQFAFGAYFVWRRGDSYPFGMFVNALGIAAVALAIERQFDGPPVAIGWALEAVVLAAICGWRHHIWAGAAAALVAALAVAHLCYFEYPYQAWLLEGGKHASDVPFANTSGLTLGLLLVAGAAGGWLARRHDVRCALATAALLLIAYALPFELDGIALLAGWAALVPASIAAERLLDTLPGVPESRARQRTVPITAMQTIDWPDAPMLATAAAAILALGHFLAVDVPLANATAIVLPATPFTDLLTASAAVSVAALLAATLLTRRPDLRVGMILVAAAVAAYTMVFELAIAFAVAAWCALAAAVAAISLRDAYGRWAYVGGAACLVVVAAAATLSQVAPVERLGVQELVDSAGPQFFVYAIVAIASIAAVLVAGAFVLRFGALDRTSLLLTAATAIVYLLSVLLVDLFQVRVGGSTLLEELQKQAQVALSILWAVLGTATFVIGIARWRQLVRESGLALLAIATIKVFLFDLSYLDVAYRVVSLMGLGLLLLAGAYVYQSLRQRRHDPGGLLR